MREPPMPHHLDDASLAELLAGSGSAAEWAHLRACLRCSDELERLRATVTGLRARFDQRARDADRLPAAAEQRILTRLRAEVGREPVTVRTASVGAWRRWAVAAATVALVLAGHAWRSSRSVAPAGPASAVSPRNDAELLAAVEGGVTRSVADVLGPLDALARELEAPPVVAGEGPDEEAS